MVRSLLVLALTMGAGGAVASAPPHVPDPSPPPLMAATADSTPIVTGTYDGPEGRRAWRLAVPPRHDPAQPRPMLVMLHGCLQDAADIARGTRLDAIAESSGILVLYPEQPAAANPRKCWNWFDPAHQHRDAGEPRLLAALIADVARTQGADPSRVHVAGISAGGAMATLLAVAYPERFASLTSVAGIGWRSATDVGRALAVMQQGGGDALPDASALLQAMGARARAMPVLIVQGGADNVVSVRNADDLVRQFVALHDTLGSRAGQSALTMHELPAVHVEGATVQERQWRDAQGAPQVTLLRIVELGHAWPHGSKAGSFTDVAGPDLSQRIGTFVAGYRR